MTRRAPGAAGAGQPGLPPQAAGGSSEVGPPSGHPTGQEWLAQAALPQPPLGLRLAPARPVVGSSWPGHHPASSSAGQRDASAGSQRRRPSPFCPRTPPRHSSNIPDSSGTPIFPHCGAGFGGAGQNFPRAALSQETHLPQSLKDKFLKAISVKLF